jgi:hypothetical protein
MIASESRSLYSYGATRLLDVPFWALHALIPVILYKDLGASPFQIACLVTLKPLLSLFSMYWGHQVGGKPDRLLGNIRLARTLAYIPFFFFPFIDNPWFFVVVYSLYMMLQLGTVPAWMELLNRNVAKEKRERSFALIQAFCYMGGGVLPFLIGGILDGSEQAWRWLFPAAACIGLCADFIQRKIPTITFDKPSPIKIDVKKPWADAYKLLKDRPDFLRYQIGFMVVGAGLMIIQPALPIFFTDVLRLSYTEISVAITFAKGLGYAIASPVWGKRLHRSDVFYFSGSIAIVAALFPVLLFIATTNVMWLYIAYFCYGIAQAGQELIWNMSGPLFARTEDSTPFTTVNLMAIGLRGALVPFLGSAIIAISTSSLPLAIGSGLCFLGGIRLFSYGNKKEIVTDQ